MLSLGKQSWKNFLQHTVPWRAMVPPPHGLLDIQQGACDPKNKVTILTHSGLCVPPSVTQRLHWHQEKYKKVQDAHSQSKVQMVPEHFSKFVKHYGKRNSKAQISGIKTEVEQTEFTSEFAWSSTCCKCLRTMWQTDFLTLDSQRPFFSWLQHLRGSCSHCTKALRYPRNRAIKGCSKVT